jgi:hypothetical protein
MRAPRLVAFHEVPDELAARRERGADVSWSTIGQWLASAEDPERPGDCRASGIECPQFDSVRLAGGYVEDGSGEFQVVPLVVDGNLVPVDHVEHGTSEG